MKGGSADGRTDNEEELDETIERGPVRKMQAKTGLPGDLLPETGLGQIPPGAKEKEGKGMNAEDIEEAIEGLNTMDGGASNG